MYDINNPYKNASSDVMDFHNVANDSPFSEFHNSVTIDGVVVELTPEQNADPTFVGSDAWQMAEFGMLPDGTYSETPEAKTSFFDKSCTFFSNFIN